VTTLTGARPDLRVWVGGPAFAREHAGWPEEVVLDPLEIPSPNEPLMLALSIAARFLRSSLGQTSLIIAGIGVGIAVQIFVGSLITSLQADLIDTTVGSSPHVTLLPDEGDTVSGPRRDPRSRRSRPPYRCGGCR
jgi:hypothetical protein